MRENTVHKQMIPIQQGLTMNITVQVSGNEETPVDHKFLNMTRVRYLDGYLFFRKGIFNFTKFWFVLKGDMVEGASRITKARLFRFRNSQTHVSGNVRLYNICLIF